MLDSVVDLMNHEQAECHHAEHEDYQELVNLDFVTESAGSQRADAAEAVADEKYE